MAKQAIPEYIYMEIADILVKNIKEQTELLIISEDIQIGGRVKTEITFTLDLDVLENGEHRGETKVFFKNFLRPKRR